MPHAVHEGGEGVVRGRPPFDICVFTFQVLPKCVSVHFEMPEKSRERRRNIPRANTLDRKSVV